MFYFPVIGSTVKEYLESLDDMQRNRKGETIEDYYTKEIEKRGTIEDVLL
jgi:hypothetical protein